MNNEQQYKHLRHLLGAYLHQDWSAEFSSPDDAIDAFREKEPLECVRGVCTELEDVIPLIESMHDPETFLWQVLWCYYYPKADGLKVADWLRHVHKRLCE
jgi:hypothetical protein